MSDKEQIDTLITTGANLPPVNPYLDDPATSNDNNPIPSGRKKRGKVLSEAQKVVPPVKSSTITPDPKEYIAELERPEEEDLF